MTTLQPIIRSEQNELENEIEQQNEQTASLSKVSKTSQSSLCDDQKDVDGAEDYDPTDSVEQAQAAKDQLDDVSGDDAKAADSEAEFVEALEPDEAELVNSEQFAEELQSAIDHVQQIAKSHRAEMLRAAKQQFERETGSAPTQQMVDEAMETMKESVIRDSSPKLSATATESATDSTVRNAEDENVSAAEMESVLEGVRALGRKHRVELENRFRAQFSDVNGAPPTDEEVSGIFARVREQFAEEARDEFLDIHDQEELEGDSDYAPTADEFTFAFFKDLEDDFAESEAEEPLRANPLSFREEMDLALSHVRELASEHRDEFANRICDIYREENGESTELGDLVEMMRISKVGLATEFKSADQRELEQLREMAEFSAAHSESSFDVAEELESALEGIRDLGTAHQSDFVDSICDTFATLNGDEPSADDLREMFQDIKISFAEEAISSFEAREFALDSERTDDASDDYRPSDDSFDYEADDADQSAFDAEFDAEIFGEVIQELNEELLADEMNFALEHVQNLASLHQNEFVNQICDIFAAENGEEATAAELYSIFGAIKQGFADEANEEAESSASEAESESVASVSESEFDEAESAAESAAESVGTFNEEAFNEDMDFALEHVQNLGALHQSEFVDSICELYTEEYGAEPSTSQLFGLFSGIQQLFAEEADQTGSAFIVSVQESESEYATEEDSEDLSERDSYAPSEDSFDYAVDAEDDIDTEFASEAESELESESVDESEAEREDYSERDSYAPSEDSFDYAVDANDSIAFASSVSASVSESATESELDSQSESESYAVSDVNSLEVEDGTEYETEEESEDDLSEQDSYDPEEDSFDYAVDAVDDIDSEFESELSESEEESQSAEESEEDSYVESVSETESAESANASFDESVSESVELSESEAISEAESEVQFDESVRDELDSALVHVRDLANLHQSEFVNEICNIIAAETEQEPTSAELYGLFGSVKQRFAEEALEQSESESVDAESEYESVQESESESESEQESEQDLSERDSYAPSEDSFDYAVDAEDDIDSEFQIEAESEIESESVDESEAEREDYSERDSYAPSEDSFDYAVDANDSIAFASSASASESATESEAEFSSSASVSVAESEVESVSASEEESEITERESEELGGTAQESIVKNVSDLWADEFGEEANADNIREIFEEVLQLFADEAEAEQYDETDEENESEDESSERAQDESANGEELTAEISEVEISENDMDETVRETYESEMAVALNTVRFVASEHQPAFFDTISNLYAEQYGEQPSVQALSDALKQVQAEFAEEAEFDSAEFAAEFESALDLTREVAESHREGLVNSICDIFSEINGKEATAEDLSGIFGRIRETFAQEAEEQFLEINDNDSEEDSEDADSDYSPDSDAFDYSRDAAEDEFASSDLSA